MWVPAASLHMEGNAARWLQVYKLNQRLGNWTQFCQAVQSKFGVDEYPKALRSLLDLRQKEGVEEYISEFDQARYCAAVRNTHLDETFFVTQFIRGLKPEIQGVVKVQLPSTVDRAALLAKMQQEILEKSKFKATKGPHQSKQQSAGIKQESKPGITGDLSKERQLREYRKVNGLCYACGEKFEPGHLAKCAKRVQIQLNNLVAEDVNMVLTDNVLQQLETEDKQQELELQLSLAAVSGAENSNSMRVRAIHNKQVMLILVDSGSSATFISSSMVATLGLHPVACKRAQVKVANGETLFGDFYVPQVKWSANGHLFSTDMRILELSAFDAILGYDWLKCHSPMLCDWEKKVLEFTDQGVRVKLCGDGAVIQREVLEVSALQVHRWLKGNEI
jgi:hypothetical protein